MFDSRQGRIFTKLMKISTKVILTLISIFVCISILIYVYLVFVGRYLVRKQLEEMTGRKVTMSSFVIIPPFNILVSGLEIDGLMKAQRVWASPSIVSFVLGNTGFNEICISKADFIWEKLPRPRPVISQDPVPIPAAPLAQPVSKNIFSRYGRQLRPPADLRLVVRNFVIKKSQVKFTDKSLANGPITINVKGLNLALKNLCMINRSAVTNFELQARIPWHEGQEEGKVSLEGWIDLFKKDILASLNIEGIDGVYLYPYYSQWADLEKSRVQKARLNFSSNIHGLNNSIAAECHLELTDIVFKKKEAEESTQKEEKIAYAVLDMFKSENQGRVVLDFTIRTKMDNPEFGMAAIRGAVEEKITSTRKSQQRPLVGDVLALPFNIAGGFVKGGTELSKALIDGTFAVGNEVFKAVDTSFKKEKTKEPLKEEEKK